jgi:hypothetical protein
VRGYHKNSDHCHHHRQHEKRYQKQKDKRTREECTLILSREDAIDDDVKEDGNSRSLASSNPNIPENIWDGKYTPDEISSVNSTKTLLLKKTTGYLMHEITASKFSLEIKGTLRVCFSVRCHSLLLPFFVDTPEFSS